MRQATMTSPGEIEYRDVPEPTPGPGQVMLRIKRIGICGSDIHVNHGTHPFTGYPVVQGHEFSGYVEAVGPGVANIAPGALATATPQDTCGECKFCRRGDYHICKKLKVFGFQTVGVAQDLFVTEAEKIVVLPDNFSVEQGAFVEPAAVAVHATDRAGDLAGANTVVLGAGPIGNLVAQAARARGANILITDLSDYRLDVARQCGLENVSNTRNESVRDAAARVFGGDGFNVAFDCAGVEASLDDAIVNIDKGGLIVVVAVFGDKPRVNMAAAGGNELSLLGTLMYRRPDYEQAVAWIADGQIRLEPLFSRHFPFEQFTDAYRYIDEEGEKTMKVFIDL